MRKITFTLSFLCIVIIAVAQDIPPRLNPREAADITKALSKNNDPVFKLNQFLKLAEFNILKAGENKKDLDSAATFIGNAKQLNARLRSVDMDGYIALLESTLARECGQISKGRNFAKEAVFSLKQSDSSGHLGDAYMESAQYYSYYIPNELPEKIKLVELAVAAYQKERKILQLAATQQFLADLYANFDDQPKALKAVKLSLSNFQSQGYKKLQGVYIIFSSIYTSRNDYRQALKYGLMALKAAESVKDTSMQLCEIYNIIGSIFTKNKEVRQGLFYYRRAFDVAVSYRDNVSIVLITRNIVRNYVLMQRPDLALSFIKKIDPTLLKTDNPAFSATVSGCYANAYRSLKRYDLAKPYIQKLIKIIALDPNAIADQDNNYLEVVRFFTETRQYSLAETYLKKWRKFLSKSGSESLFKVGRTYQLWFKLDSARGDYRSAVNHLLDYNKSNNLIFTEANNRQLKQLNLEFETKKKENEIRLKDQNIRILNQKNELQQSKLDKADLVRNIAFGSVLLLMFIMASFYNQYRMKQRTSRQIGQKNAQLQHLLTEKEWLLKEVHHRVKNNLHTVICLLESQAVYLENDALRAIESSQHRIYAMSLIHQKLYQSEDIKTIDMSVYIPEFIRYLNDSFEMEKQIRFHLEIAALQLGVSQAIPLALIINEAVTNSMKYAFLPGSVGIITLNMFREGDEITLIIADNGVGIDTQSAKQPADSLGMKLMNGLSDDINAALRVENNKGTRITIKFNEDPLHEKSDVIAIFNQKKPQL